MNTASIDEFAIKYIAKQTQGKTPEDICLYYVHNFVFKNGEYLTHLMGKYKLPGDFLRLDKKIQALASKVEACK